MKTAISLPDDTFDRASRRAQDLGMSRSEFFARAAIHYLNALDAESVTRQIDSSIAGFRHVEDSGAAAVAEGHRLLSEADHDW